MRTFCFILTFFYLVSCSSNSGTQAVQVGYEPEEKIQFSHELHAGKLKVDCAFCHKKDDESEFLSLTNSCITCHVFPENLASEKPSKQVLRRMENCVLEKREVSEYLNFKIPDHGSLFKPSPSDSVKTLSIDMANCTKCHYVNTEPFQYWRKPFQLDTLAKLIKQQK